MTICVYNRTEFLSRIVYDNSEGLVVNELTEYGEIVDEIINRLSNCYNVDICNYVIMPNHVHMIVLIKDLSPKMFSKRHSTISNIVGYLKMNASKQIHQKGYMEKIWQRSFHDHIIRDHKDFEKIFDYITNNPQNWSNDCFH